jgi:RNA polymerase sigma factor (sigma-70 family)
MTDYLGTEVFFKDFTGGHERAFKAFFNAYSVSLYLFAFKQTENKQEAEDIVQEAFIVLWQQKAAFQSLNSMIAYMYTVVRNDCLNYLKAKQAQPARQSRYLQLVKLNGGLENAQIEGRLTTQFFSLLEQLSGEQQRVFKLLLIDGLNYQEVADSMGMTRDRVQYLRKTGLEQLRKIVPPRELAIVLALHFAPLLFN